MLQYNVQSVQTLIPIRCLCDKCHTCIEPKQYEEWEERFHLEFRAGYASVFGDGNRVELDLCQSCLKELIGNFCRIIVEK